MSAIIPDWRFKLGRAQHHFKELEDFIRAYCDSHPYEALRDRERERNPNLWIYTLRIRQQPGPEIALALGDVIHNIRAALDYLATALAPKGHFTSFPIEKLDLWAKDRAGNFIVKDDEARKRFASAIKGMPDEAVTIIHELQPRLVDRPQLHPLAVLSKLENADKHRNLVPTVLCLRDVRATVFHRRDPRHWFPFQRELAEDGTEVARFDFRPGYVPPSESEMQVEVCGTPIVAMDIGLDDGYGELLPALRSLLLGVPLDVFDALEPFVRR